MAKNIKITNKQLKETIKTLSLKEDNNDETIIYVPDKKNQSPQQEITDAVNTAKQNGINTSNNKIKMLVNCSKIYTKSQLLEARRKYLEENSKTFTKANLLNK